MKAIVIDGGAIKDEPSFHDAFVDAFGFPGFYGRNMSAWVDCMTYLDNSDAAMSSIHIEAGEALVIAVKNAKKFKQQCPELWLTHS